MTLSLFTAARTIRRIHRIGTLAILGLLLISPRIWAESARPDSNLAAQTSAETVSSIMDPLPAAAPHDSTAADLPDPAQTLPTDTGLADTAELVARTGLALLAVIFLIWGAVQILKRFTPGGSVASSDAHIRVLDRAHIAPKKSIFVVQIGDRVIALGVTDQQMTHLTDLDLEDTLDRYARTAPVPVSKRFSDVMRTVNARLSRRSEEPAT